MLTYEKDILYVRLAIQNFSARTAMIVEIGTLAFITAALQSFAFLLIYVESVI